MTTIAFTNWNDLGQAQADYRRRIDEKAGEVRRRFASDWLIDEEYQLTTNEAQGYAGQGYAGDAPDTVAAWADAAGLTAQEAADDILATRDAYNAALRKVRRIRLVAKRDVQGATTVRAAYDAMEQARRDLDAIQP